MRLLPWLCMALPGRAGALMLSSLSSAGIIPMTADDSVDDNSTLPTEGVEPALSTAGLRGEPLDLAAAAEAADQTMNPTRELTVDSSFPAMLKRDRILVGKLKYYLYGVHADDIGVYVSNQSKLWGANSTAAEVLDRLPGEVTLRYRIASRFLTRSTWSRWMIGVTFKQQLKRSHCGNVSDEIHAMTDLIYAGPKLHVGNLLDFDLDGDGMTYFINGRYITKKGTRCSSVATLYSYLGPEPLSNTFKEALVSTLHHGRAASPSEVTVRHGRVGFAWAILVGTVLALVTGCAALCCCLGGWCRSSRSK